MLEELIVLIPLIASFLDVLLIAFRRSLVKYLAIISILLLLVITVIDIRATESSIIYGIFKINPLTLIILLILYIILLLDAVAFIDRSKELSIMTLYIAPLTFAIISASLPLSILSIELLSLIPIVMMVLNRNITAAVKFFIISSIGIGLLLSGLAIAAPYLSQLSYSEISFNPISLLALALILAGLGVEISIWPFNLWVADVYSEAEGRITALIASINKKVALVILIFILSIVFSSYMSYNVKIVALLATLTMLFGNIAALFENNLKKIFAYSSISQMGYMLVGLAAFNYIGVSGVIYNILIHGISIFAIFLILDYLERYKLYNVESVKGLYYNNKEISLAAVILMLSFIGVPPLAGFYAKFLLFGGALDSGLLLLVIIAIINSFISVYYYLKIIINIFSSDKRLKALKLNIIDKGAIIAVAAIIIALGVFPNIIVGTIQNAIQSYLMLP
ncbi:MAG: NADH-quinone oxidoreductase subunit N [Candidatus Micrarchaeota archaeon]|nr:MAG: NADH-quinone oxidoreductase subunit N [Candidatus Micrarchaeota archaeon]